MNRKTTATKSKPRSIALQVPKNVNLAEMSEKEIERLALDMARKAASSLPANSTLLGVDRVTLTSSQAAPAAPGGGGGPGIWGQWTRACGRAAELAREGLVVNPAAFRAPAKETPGKSVVRGWKQTGTKAKAGAAAKKSAKKKASKKASKKTSRR